ncbi:MAG TPA: protein phosphatase 2C domain-containing protein [Acetobacteraceae bacterium]|nr:protein phosphatase 2C domain-containing protein [Acetobacteraceae bacterium]
MTTLRSWSATHAGTKRGHNEDNFVDRPDLGLWAVADGAGGHEAGEIASGMIAETLGAIPPGLSAAETLAEIRTRIDAVHAALVEEAAKRGPDAIIASTAVVLCVRGAHFACLWAGDSRVYRMLDGVLEQVSHDHSLVQELVDAGQIPAEAAESHPHANIVTRAVGAATEGGFALDKTSDVLRPGERFLLCSDGLTKCVPETAIAALLRLDDPAEELIAAALERQARDNVTAVVVEAPR